MEGPAPCTLHQEQLETWQKKKNLLLWQQAEEAALFRVASYLFHLLVALSDSGELKAGHQATSPLAHFSSLVFATAFSQHSLPPCTSFSLSLSSKIRSLSPLLLFHNAFNAFFAVIVHCPAQCFAIPCQSHLPKKPRQTSYLSP